MGLSRLVEIASAVDRLAVASGLEPRLGTVGWFADSSACALASSTVCHIGRAQRSSWAARIPQGDGSAVISSYTWQHDHDVSSCQPVRLQGITVKSRHANGRNAVFLHGFLGCKEDWLPVMYALAATCITCAAIDLPGQGRHARALSVEDIATLLASVMATRDMSRCVLVGYSMGARTAMSLALRYPDVARKLVCISGTPGIKVG